MSIIIANWKMNLLPLEAFKFCEKLSKQGYHNNIIICPPALYLTFLSYNFEKITFGAQDVSQFKTFGTYTGEYSAFMLKSSRIDYAIIGHSERRHFFNETNAVIKEKAISCLKAGITPIICIGESLELRQKKQHLTFIKEQIFESIPKTAEKIILAYEPLWAINTGQTPSFSQFEEIIGAISLFLEELSIAQNTILVYGGSVNQSNIKKILSLNNIKGALIGGASLDFDNLTKIINTI